MTRYMKRIEDMQTSEYEVAYYSGIFSSYIPKKILTDCSNLCYW